MKLAFPYGYPLSSVMARPLKCGATRIDLCVMLTFEIQIRIHLQFSLFEPPNKRVRLMFALELALCCGKEEEAFLAI